MRKHTTYTDIRRIMKLHSMGNEPAEISELTFISLDAVKHVIEIKGKKKRKPREKSPEPEPTG